MPFNSTQGNISDVNGNFLMSSNGVWIANANNDTMLNGSGLNPNSFTSGATTYGLPLPNGNVFLPWPDDTTKFILFHQTGNYVNNIPTISSEVYYSVIDMTHDGGLGEVVQKNVVAYNDSIGWGLGACKHANGRDWWVVALSKNADSVLTFLLTASGVQFIGKQNLFVPAYPEWVGQPVFSPDGNKFSYSHGYTLNGGIYWYHDVRLFDFDRCTGIFSNPLVVDLSDGVFGFGVAFSPNSKYLYACSFLTIFQLNTDTSNIPASLQVVALNDSFYSPFPPFLTDFWLMYLAANGKIYLTSGNGVLDLHFINNPDSGGIACDVHQHDIHLPCFNFRTVPNHPNYYLGCDTAGGCPCLTGIDNLTQHDFRFRIYPNPVINNILNIGYQLPQNKSGLFQIFDITGKVVFKYVLSQWSNEQSFKLPELSDGVYNCVITSAGERVSKKLLVFNE